MIPAEGARQAGVRLGIYSDGPFQRVPGEPGRLAPDPADHPFLTFCCAVAAHFGSTVVFARTSPDDASPSTALLAEGIRFVELPFYGRLTDVASVLRALPGTARAFWAGLGKVDVVWAFGPHPYAVLLALLALVRRKRVVLGVRQDTVAYYRSRLPSSRWRPALLAARVWDLAFRLLARRIRTVVVGPDLARAYSAGAAEVLVATVTLLRERDVVDAPRPRDWTGSVDLFTVGRIEQEKNPLLLVEALARLQRARPGRFRLAWAGSGPLEDEVRERAVTLGMDGQLELLGFVPFGAELVDRYREAHLFVHVSLTEGVPATVLEALGAGTPVVATAVGGVPWAVDEGGAGLLVPPDDLDALVAAIERVVDEPDLRDRLVRRGLELASERTLEAQAARVAVFLGAPDTTTT